MLKAGPLAATEVGKIGQFIWMSVLYKLDCFSGVQDRTAKIVQFTKALEEAFLTASKAVEIHQLACIFIFCQLNCCVQVEDGVYEIC